MSNSLLEVTVTSFISFIWIIVFLSELGESQGECRVSNCNQHGPVVRFPFWLKDHQSKHCGYPGFELSCEGKEIVLELPPAGKFIVRSIDYTSQVLEIYDSHRCLLRPLLTFNLSFPPLPFQFHQTDEYGNYFDESALFNCSSTEPFSRFMKPIPCLRDGGHHFYAFKGYTMDELPLLFCEKVKTISLPHHFDPYDEPIYFLNWSTPVCSHCEANGKYCRLKSNSNSGSETTECFDMPKPSGTSAKPAVTGGAAGGAAGGTIGLFLLVIATVKSIRHYHHRNSDKKEKEIQANIDKFLEEYKSLKPTRYSYVEIKKITNQFKNKLGQGGYGSVFKGNLSNEIPVAVKILDNSKGNGEDFINEVGTIGRIHHVNVVRLLGFCADGFRRALVYEFLLNESLEKFIFSGDIKNSSLGWEKLQDISIGIAKGIEYLHQGCNQRILHFDIKPHNILLDHNFNPKISDFGLAKLCAKDKSVVSMTATRGTMGYIAPEVFSRNFGNVSYKSDVYSFGMVILEMVGGRKNIDTTVENTSQVYFPEWVYNRLNQGEELKMRVDEDGDERIAKKLTIVALWCIQWYPVDRPSMKVVVQMLEGDTENLIMPPNPFVSTTPPTTTVPNPKRHFHTELTIISE